MELFKQAELVTALYDSSIPCIERFFEGHQDETFFGFAIEILAEEGYFHIGASSIESFQSTIDSYSKSGEPMESIMGEEIKWNNQEWAYFDLNYDCDIWEKLWQPTLDRINSYKNYMETLSDPEWDQAQEKFSSVFESAGREAYERILASGVLENVRKTSDFRVFVFEHHEVF